MFSDLRVFQIFAIGQQLVTGAVDPPPKPPAPISSIKLVTPQDLAHGNRTEPDICIGDSYGRVLTGKANCARPWLSGLLLTFSHS
jgi:hypothetical protein